MSLVISAEGKHYRVLNEEIHAAVRKGVKEIIVRGVKGQRYIGAGIRKKVRIIIEGVAGNDLGAFMDGPEIIVKGNAQDGVGNTMSGGRIVVEGDAGDIVGYAMRGGEIYIRGDVGYRVGIHMKSYGEERPVIVVGGTAKDFLGEYMAGGILAVLGLDGNEREDKYGDFIGTGMHGGVLYLNSRLLSPETILGKEVKMFPFKEEDRKLLAPYLSRFSEFFSRNPLSWEPVKFIPYSHRPYGRLYSY